MPKKLERCVKKVKAKIRAGKIPRMRRINGMKKTSPYAICKASLKRKKSDIK